MSEQIFPNLFCSCVSRKYRKNGYRSSPEVLLPSPELANGTETRTVGTVRELPVYNSRQLRKNTCPQDSDRDITYHRLCISNSSDPFGYKSPRRRTFNYLRGMLPSSVTRNKIGKYIFANDLPIGTHEYVDRRNDYNNNNAGGHNRFSEFFLKSVDGELLHSYLLESEVAPEYIILYLHGASGNIGHRLEVAKMLQSGLNSDVLMIDYRGFGLSTGSPTELGVYLDAQAGLDYVLARRKMHQRMRGQKVIVMGTSLGAAICMHLVSQEDNAANVHVAIIENCFTSVAEISRYYVPKWAKPIIDFVGSTTAPLFNSINKADRIKCQLLYLVGARDPIVPSWMTQMLASQSLNSERYHVAEFPDGGHNDLPNNRRYCECILRFLSSEKLDSIEYYPAGTPVRRSTDRRSSKSSGSGRIRSSPSNSPSPCPIFYNISPPSNGSVAQLSNGAAAGLS